MAHIALQPHHTKYVRLSDNIQQLVLVHLHFFLFRKLLLSHLIPLHPQKIRDDNNDVLFMKLFSMWIYLFTSRKKLYGQNEVIPIDVDRNFGTYTQINTHPLRTCHNQKYVSINAVPQRIFG
jgi:hypothetical protein